MNATAPQVPNNLVWAILTTLFCCLPAGIVSIVYAAQVNGKLAAGDIAGAQESSNNAKKWAMWSAIIGVVAIVLYIILVVVMGIGGALGGGNY
ncbi:MULTISPECIES: CD225/dispanin family protein [unclassified Stenotrophomonas]|uniref:CD225/dispanin family protein n=1 Tax=unclassified Stenotrophomonas TaxID=196198 RepID=UPI001BE871C5|nr:CD225/dispanin family protein [Stenotrophomonas sp. ISL-67]MBT2767865.1 CD225/dispanin family protein [Stenotrophomonas sp. ISL-67]